MASFLDKIKKIITKAEESRANEELEKRMSSGTIAITAKNINTLSAIVQELELKQEGLRSVLLIYANTIQFAAGKKINEKLSNEIKITSADTKISIDFSSLGFVKTGILWQGNPKRYTDFQALIRDQWNITADLLMQKKAELAIELKIAELSKSEIPLQKELEKYGIDIEEKNIGDLLGIGDLQRNANINDNQIYTAIIIFLVLLVLIYKAKTNKKRK